MDKLTIITFVVSAFAAVASLLTTLLTFRKVHGLEKKLQAKDRELPATPNTADPHYALSTTPLDPDERDE